MGTKGRNLLIRSLSGVVLLGVILAALYFGKYSFAGLLLLISSGGLFEFYNLVSKCGMRPQIVLGFTSGQLLFMSAAWFFLYDCDSSSFGGEVALYTLTASVLFAMIIFVVELFRVTPTPIQNIATSLMGGIYVSLPVSLMFFIPLLLTGGVWRAEAFLFYLFIVWANDVCAYLVGVSIGRHRMFPRISPNKSWEGFVGGVVGAIGMGAVGATVVGGDMVMWLGLASVVAITAVLGDLVESMFKRAADVKDSGSILPGHGGFLDRFDAMLVSAPFAFIYLLIYNFLP